MMGGYVSCININPGIVRTPIKMDVAQNAHRNVVYWVMKPDRSDRWADRWTDVINGNHPTALFFDEAVADDSGTGLYALPFL